MDEMAKKYPVDGVPTSLADLGYKYVGVDDHWQNCTTVCPNGTVVPSWKPRVSSNGNLDYDYQSCVNVTGGKVPGSKAIPWYSDGTDPSQGPYGTPQVDTHRFPDMKAMVAHGHSLGLRPGWCASLAVSARRQFHSTCASAELPLQTSAPQSMRVAETAGTWETISARAPTASVSRAAAAVATPPREPTAPTGIWKPSSGARSRLWLTMDLILSSWTPASKSAKT